METRFLILRDQDSANCKNVKAEIHKNVVSSGKTISTKIVIACHELESFYLGDLKAVELALGCKNLSKKQEQKKFKNPDILANASEELEKITQNKYQKKSGSREIGKHLCLKSNKSQSFNHLICSIRTLLK